MSGVESNDFTPAPQPVVTVSWLEETIAVIAMNDRASKNCASPELMAGIEAAFHKITMQPEARTVILHGYDNYFCCGGTLDELLLVASQKVDFTHFSFYDACLRCEIPVIAAMQGHAIGAGLAFGCYADVTILAAESIYCANFMRYGFTPGTGASWIVPHRFGETLGWEMLMTGRNFYGWELRERGAQVRVLPRQQVLDAAQSLAREFAEIPAAALRELKRAFVQRIRAPLDSAIQQELSMHRRVFADPEAQDRIRKLYAKS